jgi:hypothetical protein
VGSLPSPLSLARQESVPAWQSVIWKVATASTVVASSPAVHGVSFFIGTLPKPACDYPSLELNASAMQGSSQHNLGFGRCVSGKLVAITASMGQWTVSQ